MADFSLDRIRQWGQTLNRGNGDQSTSENVVPSFASVNCILKPSGQESPDVLLLQRRIEERDPWSGQISFPWGRSKSGETPLPTAMREAMEETGIDLDQCELLGRMESVIPGNVSIKVTPFLAIAPQNIGVTIDRVEIVDSFWVPLEFFSVESNMQIYKLSRMGATIETPSFVIAGTHVVWGMTLRIIMNLLSGLGQK